MSVSVRVRVRVRVRECEREVLQPFHRHRPCSKYQLRSARRGYLPSFFRNVLLV